MSVHVFLCVCMRACVHAYDTCVCVYVCVRFLWNSFIRMKVDFALHSDSYIPTPSQMESRD